MDAKTNGVVDQVARDEVTPEQVRAIDALLAEQSVPKAAAAAGLHPSTLYRWLAEPKFLSVYRRARREAYGQAVLMMQRYSPLAVQALVQMVADVHMQPFARVAAATALLRAAREGIETEDLADRVRILETRVEASETAGVQ